jgi:hypothetical protein
MKQEAINKLWFMLPVGYHWYVLENFTGDTLEGVNVREEEKEFGRAAEVCTLK